MELCQKKEKKSRPCLTYNERYQIEAFCKVGIKKAEISRLLCRAKSTTSTEINKRNGQYSADNAQKRAKNAKSRSHKTRKFANEKLQHFVIRKLKDGLSPEMIVHVLNNLKYETKVSVTCVYNFINRRIELKKCAGRRYKRYGSTKTLIPERVGIEKRQKIINIELATLRLIHSARR